MPARAIQFIYGNNRWLKGLGGLSRITVTIDDAGSGDLLFGVVIGIYHSETQEFIYDVIDVQYFQPPLFSRKEYLEQASKIIFSLLARIGLKADEQVLICTSYIFDIATENLKQMYGSSRISKIKVIGEPQRLTETAYLDEIRNLGYEPLDNRENKRGKSFFHMMQWLEKHPEKIKYAKTGWPRIYRYRLFKSLKN